MSSDVSDRARLARLLTTHRASLYGFILACVRNHEDARKVLHSVGEAVSQRGRRLPGELGLLAWAREIARGKILAFSHAGSLRRPVDALVIQRLADAAQRLERMRPASDYQASLLACLEKLPAKSRLFLALRAEGTAQGMEELATRMGRPVPVVQGMLRQIKHLLHECVERQVTVKFDHGITRAK